jgi:hypothetical protein
MKAYGGVDVQLHTFLTLALDGGEWSSPCLPQSEGPLVPIGGPQSQCEHCREEKVSCPAKNWTSIIQMSSP